MRFLKVSCFVVLLAISFSFLSKPASACDTTANVSKITFVPGSCQSATCNSNVSQGFVKYEYNDGTSCTRLEYFSGNDCNLDNPASNPCPASCTSKNDCTGLGVCANPDLGYFGSEQNAISSICSGIDLGPGPKACMIIGCGYQCNTSSYSCNRSYAIDSTFGTNFPGYLKPFEDLQSCQVNCQAPPPPPPPITTPLPTPPPSATPTPPPLNISCSASPTSIKTGQLSIWTATASGGNGPYLYSWVGSEGFNTANQTINTATVYYNIAGNKTASLTVRSGDGQTKTVSCSNSVDVIAPLSLSCSPPQPASGQVETQFILSSSAKGGSGNYIYYWNIQEPNRYPKLLGGTSSSSSIPWTPTTEGNTTASVTVYSGGQSASCTPVNFTVSGHFPTSFNVYNSASCKADGVPSSTISWSVSRYASSYRVERWSYVNNRVNYEGVIDTVKAIDNYQNYLYNYSAPVYYYTDNSGSLKTARDYLYVVTAQNSYGSQQAVTSLVNAKSCVKPTVDLKINSSDGPVNAVAGDNPTISWTSSNTSFCFGYYQNRTYNYTYYTQSGALAGALSATSGTPYVFTASCYDNDGNQSAATDTVQVFVNPKLAASCSANNSYATVGTAVSWTTTALGGPGTYTYNWTGADGLSSTDGPTTKTSSTISGTYQTVGEKNASVTVTSPDGQTTGQMQCQPSILIGDQPPTAFRVNDPKPDCNQTTNKPYIDFSWIPSQPSSQILNYGLIRINNSLPVDDNNPDYYFLKTDIPPTQITYRDDKVRPADKYTYYVFSLNQWGGNMGIPYPIPLDSWYNYPDIALHPTALSCPISTPYSTPYTTPYSTPYTTPYSTPATLSPAVSPYIQTFGGDVHSNEGIKGVPKP